MPWCEECAKYYTPNSVSEDGTCPTCGRTIETAEGSSPDAERLADEKAPWHFKLLIGMTVVYLVWRFVQIFT